MLEVARCATDVYDALALRIGESLPCPRLDATLLACNLLGDVHTAFKVIHITGTNGKSSTARITANIVSHTGLRCGLLTSPHLVCVNERICIDNEPITSSELVRAWNNLYPIIQMADKMLQAEGKPKLTYFETLTAFAYGYFADVAVDVAVIEVGLGGEWDSTNVADADVAVFSPIDIDHEAKLGKSPIQIAKTKSGIIKPKTVSIISANQPHRGVIEEIESAAKRTRTSIVYETRDFSIEQNISAKGGRLCSFRTPHKTYNEVYLSLLGSHQAQNAAVAICAVEELLGKPIDEEILHQALGSAFSPGRLQLIASDPPIILDAAHNPHSAKALASALWDSFGFESAIFVVALCQDKDIAGVLRALLPVAKCMIFCAGTGVVRHADPAHLKRMAIEIAEQVAPDTRIISCDTVESALARAREESAAESAADNTRETTGIAGDSTRTTADSTPETMPETTGGAALGEPETTGGAETTGVTTADNTRETTGAAPAKTGSPIVVTGSIFLLGEVVQLCQT